MLEEIFELILTKRPAVFTSATSWAGFRDPQLSKKKEQKLRETVKVKNSENGRGLFAKKDFAKDAVIGRVKGKVVSDEKQDPRYVMELENDLLLIPKTPFRFLNHRCRPNCVLFDWEDGPVNPKTGVKNLYLGAIRKIKSGAELTIDYSWPAKFAIPCECDSKKCRGYIVAEEELHLMPDL